MGNNFDPPVPAGAGESGRARTPARGAVGLQPQGFATRQTTLVLAEAFTDRRGGGERDVCTGGSKGWRSLRRLLTSGAGLPCAE